MNRTVIYARVSTEDQVEKYGLATQLRACREFAVKNSLVVIVEITDDGISGVILDRPGLDRVRQMVRERQADVVLMLDADRLSRELAHLLILKPEIEKSARMEFVTAKFEDSPSGRMFFGIRGVIAQYERELTRERTMRGRKERARAGLIVGGRTALGYRYSDGKLAVDAENASAVRRIFNAYDGGLSLRGIAMALRSDGVQSWSGRPWGKSSIRRILSNETYAGVAYYGTLCRDGKVLRRREAMDRIAVVVPALVARDQWERVQSRLLDNPMVGRPSTFLLRGLLHCGKCGRRMCGEKSRKSASYRCAGRDQLHTVGVCRNHVGIDRLDRSVWSAIARTFTDACALGRIIARSREDLKSSAVDFEGLRRKLASARRKEELTLSAMLDPDLASGRDAIKVEYKAALNQRKKLEDEIARHESLPESPDEWLEEAVSDVRLFVSMATDAALKQQFIRGLMSRAEWDGEFIKMNCFITQKLATSSARYSQFQSLQIVLTERLAA